MAVPKKRTSKSRKRMRRSHHHIRYSAASVECECGELRLRHHVCMSCGQYKGQQVLELDNN